MSRKEGGKIFGSGSRAPIAISILVKNPEAKEHGKIYFHDIGDYLTREEKLEKVVAFGSTAGITETDGWETIVPDQHGDYLNQRDVSFSSHLPIGGKKGKGTKLFDNYSQGVLTSRDGWCFNASQSSVSGNMGKMIRHYNSEVERFSEKIAGEDRVTREKIARNFVDTDPTRISWSSSLIPSLVRQKKGVFDNRKIVQSLYRPFTKQWLYYDPMFNHRVSQMPQIFPDAKAENRVICVTGIGESKLFSVQIVNAIPEFKHHYNGQCFPLYLYEEAETGIKAQHDLFADTVSSHPGKTRREAITDDGLAHFSSVYSGEKICKQDVFYYIYGLLHSPDYRD